MSYVERNCKFCENETYSLNCMRVGASQDGRNVSSGSVFKMHTEVFDFIENGSEKWLVYAKNSQCLLGTIEWREDKKLYDYVPNSNGKLMKVLHQPDARRELQ